MHPGSVLHESRTFIEAEGKPAQPIPEFRVGNARVSHTYPLSALNLEALNDLSSLPFGSIRKAESVGRWLAMSLKEEDPFKRFMWAFAGLEVLSGKAAQSWKSRALTLIASNESISLELAKELLWPTDGDESREPWRSLVFRFSIMAIVVNAETATDDLVKFKDIQSFRNKIHGHHIDERVVEQKAAVAMDLLRRYAPSVVDSLQRRPGIPLCLIPAILANTICGQRG